VINDLNRTWKVRWSAQGDIVGGGQGDVKRVVRSDGRDDTVFFLKILIQQNDQERRRRMYREVAAYRTLEHQRIPKLVDSNVDSFQDPGFRLYLVTEHIPGVTLSQFIAQNGPIDVETCMTMTSEILEVVQYCHDSEWVHRDIKPDNIVLRNASPVDPVLVDFGLSFNSSEEPELGTPTLVELGNRFLRLPELAAGSPMKRDPRSDVTFCGGVFLYGLTGIMPSLLLDESRRLPHQRPSAINILSARFAPKPLQRLLTIFDRTFEIDLSRRWQSAAELRSAIERLNVVEQTPEDEISALWREVEEYRTSTAAKSSEANSEILQNVIDNLNRATHNLRDRLGGSFQIAQTNFEFDPFKGRAGTSFAVQRKGKAATSWVKFSVEIIGSEVVINSEFKGQTESLHRTSSEQLTFGPSFAAAVEISLLRQFQSDLAERA
jgi:eukaryotic-like serine/threonine-protein kinase